MRAHTKHYPCQWGYSLLHKAQVWHFQRKGVKSIQTSFRIMDGIKDMGEGMLRSSHSPVSVSINQSPIKYISTALYIIYIWIPDETVSFCMKDSGPKWLVYMCSYTYEILKDLLEGGQYTACSIRMTYGHLRLCSTKALLAHAVEVKEQTIPHSQTF